MTTVQEMMREQREYLEALAAREPEDFLPCQVDQLAHACSEKATHVVTMGCVTGSMYPPVNYCEVAVEWLKYMNSLNHACGHCWASPVLSCWTITPLAR